MSKNAHQDGVDQPEEPLSAGGPEMTPAAALEEESWTSVTTPDGDDVTETVSEDTRVFDEVEPTDESFAGFEENVAVLDPHSEAPHSRFGSGVSAATVTQEALVVEDSDETTQVLRRSLLTSEEVVPTSQAGTFEEAMSKAQPDPIAEVAAEVAPTIAGRGLPRFLSLLLTLIFTPIAWYLVSDAAARLAFATDNPMVTGIVNKAALGELFAGLIAIAIIALLAAQSSLGLIVAGAITLAVGVPFLFIPALVSDTGYWGLTRLANWNDFGANVSNHFLATGFTGLFFALGFLMIALGWALAWTRRTGRQEEALRIVVATENPAGLKARWARKATENAHSR